MRKRDSLNPHSAIAAMGRCDADRPQGSRSRQAAWRILWRRPLETAAAAMVDGLHCLPLTGSDNLSSDCL